MSRGRCLAAQGPARNPPCIPPPAYVRRVILFASSEAVHFVRRKPMIRSWTLAAIGLAALRSIGAKAADPLPTETFKILPAALAVDTAGPAVASVPWQSYHSAHHLARP